ncbi:MAG: DUF4863 family protein [Myxococcota bacterium]|nr:DUF4863 family protein [Myxococcota bacterium]
MSQSLLEALSPILQHIASVDISAPSTAEELNATLPIESELLRTIKSLVVHGINNGELTPRGEEGMRYGRLSKAVEASLGFSIDAVHMTGPGPGHTHPTGEIDLCFALSGDPRFDGEPPGWVVKAPGSWHVPTVTGGEMAILYFLPEGAIQFGPRPE